MTRSRSEERAPTKLAYQRPEWLTIREAAFVAEVSDELIVRWMDAGLVRSAPLVPGRRDPALLMIRTVDLLIDADEAPGQPSLALPSRTRGRRLRAGDWVRIVLGIALLGVWLHAIRPVPVGDGASVGLLGGDPSVGAADLAQPTAILIRGTAFLQVGSRVVAVARATNPDRHGWFPAVGVLFVARAEDGTLLATATTAVRLGPGGTRMVVAEPMRVPDQGPRVALVEAVALPRPLQSLDSFHRDGLAIDRAGVEVARHRVWVNGAVRSRDGVRRDVAVSCATFAADGSLTGASSTELERVPTRRAAPFRLPIRPGKTEAARAVCSVAFV